MAIFGSYIGRERSLADEALLITVLDTFVSLAAGLIVILACFDYGVDVAAGPGLIFIALPNIFCQMPLGQLYGALVFVCMTFSAMTPVVAVFEHIAANAMDALGWSRRRACAVNFSALFALAVAMRVWVQLVGGFRPARRGHDGAGLGRFYRQQ
jgi:NSS family neurotransmitter:Na+ symporter